MKEFLDKNRAWVALGVIFLGFYIYDTIDRRIHPPKAAAKPILFDNIEKTEEVFNAMRIGRLSYYCSENEGWMYVGKRIGSLNGKNNGMVSIDIRGNCSQIDSLTLDCDVYKIRNQVRQNTVNQYRNSVDFTLRVLDITPPASFDFTIPHNFISAGYKVVTIPDKEYYTLKVYRQI